MSLKAVTIFAFISLTGLSANAQVNMSHSTDTIYHSAIISNWINYINTFPFQESKCTRSYTTGPNMHNPEDTDTLIVYEGKYSVFRFLGTPYKRLVLDCEIADPAFVLPGNVHPGLTRQEISGFLRHEVTSNSLVISEEEGYGIHFELFFAGETLVLIYFHSYTD